MVFLRVFAFTSIPDRFPSFRLRYPSGFDSLSFFLPLAGQKTFLGQFSFVPIFGRSCCGVIRLSCLPKIVIITSKVVGGISFGSYSSFSRRSLFLLFPLSVEFPSYVWRRQFRIIALRSFLLFSTREWMILSLFLSCHTLFDFISKGVDFNAVFYLWTLFN